MNEYRREYTKHLYKKILTTGFHFCSHCAPFRVRNCYKCNYVSEDQHFHKCSRFKMKNSKFCNKKEFLVPLITRIGKQYGRNGNPKIMCVGMNPLLEKPVSIPDNDTRLRKNRLGKNNRLLVSYEKYCNDYYVPWEYWNESPPWKIDKFCNKILTKLKGKTKNIWESIVFTNFVKCRCRSGDGRPTTEMWENCSKIINKEIKLLKPQIILCISEETYKQTLKLFNDKEKIKQEKSSIYKYVLINIDNYEPILILRLRHPSPNANQSISRAIKNKNSKMIQEVKKYRLINKIDRRNVQKTKSELDLLNVESAIDAYKSSSKQRTKK